MVSRDQGVEVVTRGVLSIRPNFTEVLELVYVHRVVCCSSDDPTFQDVEGQDGAIMDMRLEHVLNFSLKAGLMDVTAQVQDHCIAVGNVLSRKMLLNKREESVDIPIIIVNEWSQIEFFTLGSQP